MELLEGGSYDWVHAAAHGNYYPQSPDSDSALWLKGPVSCAGCLSVRRSRAFHSDRPAFFVNFCQVGRQEWH